MSTLSLTKKTTNKPRTRATELIIAAAAGLAFLAMSLPEAQANFTYTDFSNPAGLTTNGTAATMGTSMLIVTPTGLSQAGSVWHTAKEAVGTFTTSFDFAVSHINGVGADGFAFVIQNQALNALGATGGALGYADNLRFPGTPGISNSLAVEFDLWNNQVDWDDFNSNTHISVQTNGTNPNKPSEAFSLGHAVMPSDFVDGVVHHVVISYSSNTMDIFLDNLVTPLFSVSVNLTTLLNLDVGNTAWVGFTASTGGIVNSEQHELRSWDFAGTAPAPGVGASLVAGGLLVGGRRRRRA